MPELEKAKLYSSDSGESDFDSGTWSGSELGAPGEGEEVEQPAPNPDSRGGDRSLVVFNKADKDWSSVYATGERFRTKELLIQWAKRTGFCHNQVLVCRTPTGRDGSVVIMCELNGVYCPEKEVQSPLDQPSKRQKCGNEKTYCPFKLTGMFDPSVNGWKISVNHGYHNHDILRRNVPDNSLVGGLTEPEKALIRELLMSRVKLKNMSTVIKKRFPKNVSKVPQIHAYILKLKNQRRMQVGRMQELIKLLNSHQFVSHCRFKPNTMALSDLFFSHPSGRRLASLFPHVILIDSTKDTTRYDYPCLHIVGFTSGWHNFSIASAFMTSEKEEHYTWVLKLLRTVLKEPPVVIFTDRESGLISAVSHVFPESKHMLCREHFFRHIRERAKKKSQHAKATDAFVRDCGALLKSKTKKVFEKIRANMHDKWKTRWRLMEHLEDVWLKPYKERIVCAWTDQILHFGHNTSIMVETPHTHLIRFLHSASDDLTKAWEAFHEMWEFQVREIDIRLGADRMLQTRTARVHTFFKRISSRVSDYATRKVLEEWNVLQSSAYQPTDHKTCRCTIKKTHALPCAHELDFYLKTPPNELPVESFHVFWRQLSTERDVRDEGEVVRGKSFGNQVNDFMEVVFPTLSEVEQERIIGLLMTHGFQQFIEMPDPEPMPKGHKPQLHNLPTRRLSSALENLIENIGREKDTFDIREHDPDCLPVPTQIQGRSFQASRDGRYESRGGFTHQTDSEHDSPEDIPRAAAVPASRVPDYLVSDKLPIHLRCFVTSWWDARGDGNSGYRVITNFLELDQEAWPRVRQSLFLELFEHWQDTYSTSLSTDAQKTLLHRIAHFNGAASTYHWFTDECAMIAAGAYNAVVVLVSSTGHSVTYLPMWRDDSRPPIPEREIWILNLSSVATGVDHYKGMYMRANSPLPPLHPSWIANHKPKVAFLQSFYKSRLSSWNLILPPS